MRTLRVVSLLLTLMLLAATLGLAVPSINVNVQGIGAGSSPIIPVICVGGFYFAVGGIVVEFASPIPPDSTVYVVLHDYSGDLLASNHTSLPEGLSPNTPLLIGFNSNVLDNADLARTSVIVVDGMGDVIYNGTIGVSVQRLSSGKWNGELAQPINITYKGNETLKNWPVKIVLSDSNPENQYGFGDLYINWTFLEKNVDTIHFVDSEGRPLYYWIEILNTTTHYAVIWVNVTDIPPGGTTIWMVYGAGNFSSYNNGSKVFPFFDDFERWEGWTQYKNGVVHQVEDAYPGAYHQEYAAEKTSYNDPNGAYKNLSRTFNRDNQYGGIILEYWDNRVSDTGGNLDRVGLIDDNGNGYGAVLNAINGWIQIDVRTDYTGSRHSKSTLSLSTATWYFVRLEVINNGSIDMAVYNATGGLIGSTSYVDTSYSSFSRVYIFGGQTYHVDGLRVRYYTPNPPQAHVDEWYRYLSSHPSCGEEGYSEPSRPIEVIVPVTVDNTNNPELDSYVVNFSVPAGYFSSGWKYFYVTDENGNYLYFWNFTDGYRNVTYFWVNYTVPSGSTTTIYLHIVNQPTSAYISSLSYRNPEKVFWYFNDTEMTLESNQSQTVDYDPNAIINSGYDGYAFDTWVDLSMPATPRGYGPYMYSIQVGSREYGTAINDSSRYSVDLVYNNSNSVMQVWKIANLTHFDPDFPNLLSQIINMSTTYSWYYTIYYVSYQISSNGDYEGSIIGRSTTKISYIQPVIGQNIGSTRYYWIGIRPYYNSPPTITVGSPELAGP